MSMNPTPQSLQLDRAALIAAAKVYDSILEKGAINIVDGIIEPIVTAYLANIQKPLSNEQPDCKEIAAKLAEACNVALGHLTGGLDGDWRDCDPHQLLRDALAEYNALTSGGKE